MSYKTAVIAVFTALILGVLYLASDMKNAYKILPVSTSNRIPALAVFSDWRQFIAQSGKFKVMLPATPQYAKEAIEIPGIEQKRRYEMYASEKLDGTLFMISLITYPQEVNTSNTNEMLNGIVNELIANNPTNRLMDVKDTDFQAQPALDFKINSNQLRIEGKIFMLEKTVYLLTYTANQSNFDLNEYQHFIDSFDLLPKALNK